MDTLTLTVQQFEDFRDVISTNLGIKMPPTKRIMLQCRLHRRLRELGLDTFDEYHARFFQDREHQAAEIEHLLNLATTNKTDFFRERHHFDFLTKTALPSLLERARLTRMRRLRIWSAGCSTGEEPYTIAMVLEERRCSDPRFSYRIFASDLSTQVLGKAKEAIYEASKADVVPMSFKKKYMLRSREKDRNLVRLKPEIRARVSFARINFMDAEYGLDDVFDVVFCRNVIIYFERAIQEAILGKLCAHINLGGWLVLGHSESLAGMSMPLRAIAPTIYERL